MGARRSIQHDPGSHAHVERADPAGRLDGHQRVAMRANARADPGSFRPHDDDAALREPIPIQRLPVEIGPDYPESSPLKARERPRQVGDRGYRQVGRRPGSRANRRRADGRGAVGLQHHDVDAEAFRGTEYPSQIAGIRDPVDGQNQGVAVGSSRDLFQSPVIRSWLAATDPQQRAPMALRVDVPAQLTVARSPDGHSRLSGQLRQFAVSSPGARKHEHAAGRRSRQQFLDRPESMDVPMTSVAHNCPPPFGIIPLCETPGGSDAPWRGCKRTGSRTDAAPWRRRTRRDWPSTPGREWR